MFKIFILAGSATQHMNFLKGNNLDSKRFIHISTLNQTNKMRGVEEFAVLRIGTWYNMDRPIIKEVEEIEQVMLMRMKGDRNENSNF